MINTESKATTLWLVRHGQRMDTNPEWKPQVCHHTEVPLSPLGLAQAQALGKRLAGARIDHLFCSPYLRAVQTADAVAQHIRLPIKIEHGAMEWQDIGMFPNKPPLESVEQLAARFPVIDTTYRSRVTPVWPEDHDQALARMRCCVEALIGEYDGSILIVGHGLTVVGMAKALLDPAYPVEDAQCGIVRVGKNRQGAWRLQLNGDADHLAALGGPTY